jgi:DNA-binding SARP family transcriptional activator
VLAILLLHLGEVVSSERLIDALWGERPPATAAKTLQGYVSHLRKGLGDGVLQTRGRGYQLLVEQDQLDADRFERLSAEGRAALRNGDAASAAERLRRALRLWRGPALVDFTYEQFARAEIARLEEARMATLEDRLDADLALGRHAEVIGELEGLVRDHPLRERLRGQLLLALYRSRRQAEALDVYQAGRRALVDELGIEPSRHLRDLHQAILEQDAALDLGDFAGPDATDAGTPTLDRPSSAFVGRERELAELRQSYREACGGQGRLVLVSGEPGIGKSRLVDQLADYARSRGARLLVGRCWEAGGAPAYWPWVQSLRSYIREIDTGELVEELGSRSAASAIAQLLPDLGERLADLPPAISVESDGARFRLFDATASFLRNATRASPIVVVLDDLHAADTPSLLLLQFVARELAEARMLIVGVYRDVALGPNDPLMVALGELHRERATRRLRLDGLTKADVSEFIALTMSEEPSDALTELVYAHTGGNPLFVDEVVRLLSAEGRLNDARRTVGWTPTAIPPSVRDVIGRRLDRLGHSANQLLTIAAVLGREFAADAVVRLSGLSLSAGRAHLHEALAAHVVSEAPIGRERFRFSHGLVRDAIYHAIPPVERARLHRRVGEMLEQTYAADLDSHLGELSHHFVEAVSGGDAAKALDYTRRAGDRAQRLLAFEEAVRLYQLALEVFEWRDPSDEPARCDLLLAMGDAQMRAGDGPGARDTFKIAAGTARRGCMSDRLGRAALGYGGRFVWSRAAGDPLVGSLLETALTAPGIDGSLKVRLLARLAGALRDPPTRERAASLSREAIETARQLDDPAALAYALGARHVVVWGPDSGPERRELVDELIGLATRTADAERAFEGRFWRLESLLELGDVSAAKAEIEVAGQVAEQLRQPAQRWYVAVTRAQIALLEGTYGDAERLVEEALERGRQAQGWEALVYYRMQIFCLRSAQGRLAEVQDTVERSVVEHAIYYPVFRCVLASMYCELDDEARCRQAFEALSRDGFVALPRDEEWLFAMTLLAPVCVYLGDKAAAASIYDLLEPYGDRNAISVPDASTGAVSRCLGNLAAASGQSDRAAAHFEHALEMNARMGARPWLARTQHEYAAALAGSDQPGACERVCELLALSVSNYQQLGMHTWERAAANLRRDYLSRLRDNRV